MSRSTEFVDGFLVRGARGAAALAACACLFVLGYLLWGAVPALTDLGPARLALDDTWHPETGRSGSFGLGPALAGSLFVALASSGLAVPVGVLSAIGAHSFLPRGLARSLDVAMGVLAGVPSVVLGLWGLVSLVPLVARLRAPGTSVLSAAFVVGLMCLPTVHITARAALRAVPADALRAAQGLGLSRWAVLRAAVLPSSLDGLGLGAVLALTRALGETMVVVMVAGNVAVLPSSLLDPVRTLTANIALEMGYAQGLHRAALFASGALLLVLVAFLAGAPRLLGRGGGDA